MIYWSPMVVKLSLHTPNKFALINKSDFDRVKRFKWYLFRARGIEYACASIRIVGGRAIRPMTMHEVAVKRRGLSSGSRFGKTPLFGNESKIKHVFLHRFIMKPGEGMEVDHISGDGLDNRRINLRVCTRKQNGRNRKLSSLNTSGYHGISYSKDSKRLKRWAAAIRHDGTRSTIGRYHTKEEAALAYNEAAKKYHGEFATLNILKDEIYIDTQDKG